MQAYFIRDAQWGTRRRRRPPINRFAWQIFGLLLVLIALVGLARAGGNPDPAFGAGAGKLSRPGGTPADLGRRCDRGQ